MPALTSTTFYGVPGTTIGTPASPFPNTAEMQHPKQVEVDEAGNVYTFEEDFNIRRFPAGTNTPVVIARRSGSIILRSMAVSPDGTIFVAYMDFTSGSTRLLGIAMDPDSPYYDSSLAYHDNGSPTWTVDKVGVKFLAGSTPGFVDDTGSAAKLGATFIDFMAAHNGGCYFYDHTNARIRHVDLSGNVDTRAGDGTAGIVDGGPGTARVKNVQAMTWDTARYVYFIDEDSTGTYKIRKLDTAGGADTVSTLFTISASDFTGATTLLLRDLAWAPDGKLYAVAIVDQVGRVIQLPISGSLSITEVTGTWSEYASPLFGEGRGIGASPDGDLFLAVYPDFDAYAVPAESPGAKAFTIQQISSVFTPPRATNNLSTLTDTFGSINPAKWDALGTVASVAGAAQLGDAVISGYLTSANEYYFDSAQVKINAAGYGSTPLWIEDVNTTDALKIVIRPGTTWYIRAEWVLSGSSGNSGNLIEYEHGVHKYVRIYRTVSNTVVFEWSTDGLDWNAIQVLGVSAGKFRFAKAVMIGNLATSLDDFNILVPTPPTEPDDIPDPFDPGVVAPDDTEVCVPLIDLLREFSTAVKRPFRIIDATTIEMVNINHPLPTGFTPGDAADMYYATVHQLVAGEKVLALDTGSLALNVSAALVTDDVRLPVSDWLSPHQLPIYGLNSGLVKRVSYSFTPKHFTASVEFHLRPVPLSVRRS